jgi:FtsP/CotA-like multicopper oxidase with cupredoxin domain
LTATVGLVAAVGGPERATVCDITSAAGPSADLYCFDLVPTADFVDATASVRLGRSKSPFGVSVTVDGQPRYELDISIGGLPKNSELEPETTFVAWVTTPLLDPMIRLGDVKNGRHVLGTVEFNKFVVLITAETDSAGARPAGQIVLRGSSPSMAIQPHDLPTLLSTATAGRVTETDDGEWVDPPMHSAVLGLAGLSWLAPDANPFLPPPSAALLPAAQPPSVMRLDDGDSLHLIAAPVRHSIGGRTFTMYGFNGQIPGPLVSVSRDATIVIGFENRLGLPTTVHWHGVRLDNAYDGVPGVTQDAVPPGGTFRYEIHFPDPGLFWYHPHHREDILQDLGLYGNIRVMADAMIPADREEYLVLDDLLVADEGMVPFGHEAGTHALMGRFGNQFLINGEPDYALAVDQNEVVRFFITNVSNTRVFNLGFDGAAIKVIGSDLGRFEHETWVPSVVIAPAERYILDVQFGEPGPRYLINAVQSLDHVAGRFFAEIDTLGQVNVAESMIDDDQSEAFLQLHSAHDVIDELKRYRPYFDRPVDHELVLTLEADSLPFPLGTLLRFERSYFNPVEWSGTMPRMNWATTSKRVRWVLRDPTTGKENMEIDWRFGRGDIVKLRLVNSRDALHAMQHPIHVHGQRMLILSQNGARNENLVWKDTLLLPAGGTAEVLLDLTNPGVWMVHCHIAEHLETGMKTTFTVE